MHDDAQIQALVRDAERADDALAAEWHAPPAPSARPPKIRRAARNSPCVPPVALVAPPAVMAPPGVLATREDQIRYIMAGVVDAAGNAHAGRFTVVSVATGARYTFRAKPPSGKDGGECRKCSGTGLWNGRRGYECFSCKGTGTATATTDRLFVSVLTGADNVNDYSYLGQILRTPHCRWEHGRKSRIGPDAPSAKAAQWYLSRLFGNGALDDVVVYHDGSCGRCGRDLTDPASVARGIGPECWEKMGGA